MTDSPLPTWPEALAIFSRQVEHGFTTFDCADIYEGTEELIGRFRDTLPDPGSIEVHTKCVPDKGALAALTDAQIEAMIDRSRKRLRTDRPPCLHHSHGTPGDRRLSDRLWSSKWMFLAAAIGSVVGIANVWKFTYVAGENGGGTFVIVYVLAVVAIALPALIAEFLVGRRGP